MNLLRRAVATIARRRESTVAQRDELVDVDRRLELGRQVVGAAADAVRRLELLDARLELARRRKGTT